MCTTPRPVSHVSFSVIIGQSATVMEGFLRVAVPVAVSRRMLRVLAKNPTPGKPRRCLCRSGLIMPTPLLLLCMAQTRNGNIVQGLFSTAAFTFSLAAVCLNSWAVVVDGGDRLDHFGLFRHCSSGSISDCEDSACPC